MNKCSLLLLFCEEGNQSFREGRYFGKNMEDNWPAQRWTLKLCLSCLLYYAMLLGDKNSSLLPLAGWSPDVLLWFPHEEKVWYVARGPNKEVQFLLCFSAGRLSAYNGQSPLLSSSFLDSEGGSLVQLSLSRESVIIFSCYSSYSVLKQTAYSQSFHYARLLVM